MVGRNFSASRSPNDDMSTTTIRAVEQSCLICMDREAAVPFSYDFVQFLSDLEQQRNLAMQQSMHAAAMQNAIEKHQDNGARPSQELQDALKLARKANLHYNTRTRKKPTPAQLLHQHAMPHDRRGRAAHHARRAIRARAGCGVGRPSTVYSCNPYRVYALRSGPPVRQAAPACGGPFQHWGPFRRVLIHRGDVIRVDDVEDPAVSGARRVVSRWKVEGDPGATRLVDVHVERKCASHASRSYTYTGAPSSSPHFHLAASGLSCEAVQLISHGSQRASSR